MKKYLASAAVALSLMATLPAYAEEGKGGREGFHQHMEQKLSQFPQDKQDLIKKTFESGKAAGMANREKGKALHEQIKQIVTAPKFDKAAYLAKTSELNNLHSAGAKDRAERMANLFAQLTPDERQKFVEMMPKHHGWHHGPKDGKAPEKAPTAAQ